MILFKKIKLNFTIFYAFIYKKLILLKHNELETIQFLFKTLFAMDNNNESDSSKSKY